MKKKNKVLATSIIVFIFTCLIFTLGCSSKGSTPKNISNKEIYPNGTINTAKILDQFHTEKAVTLNQKDFELQLQIIKSSEKKLIRSYESEGVVELNITLTDSTIQLVRKDSEIVYYVFHNKKINGICYEIQSKELSEFIWKFIS